MHHPPQFASDNWSGLCPEALEYLVQANAGSAPAYGYDEWTARAADAVRELFEHDADVYFAFNGTAANSMALAHLCQPYQAIVCHAWSHIETDECGAPGFFSHGARLLLGQGDDGKLSLSSARSLASAQADLRFPRPVVLSLTQSTEVGTVYTPGELSALSGLAKEHGMNVHVDGARLMNAVAALGVSPAELSWKAGVDVLSLGASKTGGGIGDTVVFFDRDLARGFDFRCKQSGQLAAKMRLMTAPLLGLIETGAWLRNAHHANECAAYFEERLATTGIKPAFPRQANAVFIRLAESEGESLRRRGWPFYVSACHGAARFMCGWDATRERIDALVEDIGHSIDPDARQRPAP
ncbi:low specificity L-threonine aldolase [Methylococcus sp. EFPC2]|uniref:threonine aldolase family protein n=1 Tax=Methylococcus sp. EFPC2 TaxID=2812648 RepID=UPI001967B882|nr:low specificity L-threonine aldolase [Methylococcus sp. EFPC2]QSA97636.1 low specificity L-threonine aldolase [Methylococcus sp. EFPC2]